jgi:hypothetical protein
MSFENEPDFNIFQFTRSNDIQNFMTMKATTDFFGVIMSRKELIDLVDHIVLTNPELKDSLKRINHKYDKNPSSYLIELILNFLSSRDEIEEVIINELVSIMEDKDFRA